MEIRNALQKIENYLTVVSNLNRTILSEGTMSRDELLLMKKYLYTSIDRIEDIERSLIIDKREDKSFTPTVLADNTYSPAVPKEKEIVEVTESEHMDDVEAVLNQEQKEEFEDLVEEIQAESNEFQVEMPDVFTSEQVELEAENNNVEVPSIEFKPVVESIITEDYSIKKSDSQIADELPLVESEDEVSVLQTPAATSFVDSIITEDYSVNKLFENKEENSKAELVGNTNELVIPLVKSLTETENIITEDYALNKNEQTIVDVNNAVATAEVNEIGSIKKEIPLVASLVDKYEEKTPLTFAEQIESSKSAELSLSEQLEQKLSESSQPQLFESFDDGKEELHESFAKNSFTETVNTIVDKPLTASAYEHDTVLVAEKEETVVDELTPSSLNEIFKPQTIQEVIGIKAAKTLNECIALNDKFIFVRELFGNHFGEYEAGLKDLEATNSFTNAEKFCKDKLWNKYNWSDKTVAVERFMAVLQKRFN